MKDLSYFLHVKVSPSYLESKISSHPGVAEVVVKGIIVEGVGRVPRAFISLKPGFSVKGEELAAWVNSRLEWRNR